MKRNFSKSFLKSFDFCQSGIKVDLHHYSICKLTLWLVSLDTKKNCWQYLQLFLENYYIWQPRRICSCFRYRFLVLLSSVCEILILIIIYMIVHKMITHKVSTCASKSSPVHILFLSSNFVNKFLLVLQVDSLDSGKKIQVAIMKMEWARLVKK